MNKTKLYGGIAIGLLIINLMLIGFMVTKGGKMGKHHKGPKAEIIQRLHLDDDQIAALESAIDEHRSVMKTTEVKIRAQKTALTRLLKTDDTHQSDSILQLISGFHQNIERGFFTHFLAIKSICRPDQMDDYNALVDDMNEVFFKRRPHKRGRRNK